MTQKTATQKIFVFLLFLSTPLFSQTQPIKVYLLACFDFQNYPAVFDASDLYRQKEIFALTRSLCLLKPDKVFLPFPVSPASLSATDSMLRAFCRGDSTRHANAHLQLGFRTANQLHHHKVFSYGTLSSANSWNEAAESIALKHAQQKIMSGKERGCAIPKTPSYPKDSLLKVLSLKDFLCWMNSKPQLISPSATKVSRWTRLGTTHLYSENLPDYAGTRLLSKWYEENILLFSTLINQLDFGEKAILIFTDMERLTLLRHLFDSHPAFQVIPHESWLGKSPIP